MRDLPDGEYEKLKSAQEQSMTDICHVYHPSMSSGTYGNSVETLTLNSGVACAFAFTNGAIRQRGQLLLVDYDATLMLPAETPVFLADEIQLVELGMHMVSGTFRPASQPIVTDAIQYVELKRIAT
jgi:hypothetical protein